MELVPAVSAVLWCYTNRLIIIVMIIIILLLMYLLQDLVKKMLCEIEIRGNVEPHGVVLFLRMISLKGAFR